jgi:hypothetical protein
MEGKCPSVGLLAISPSKLLRTKLNSLQQLLLHVQLRRVLTIIHDKKLNYVVLVRKQTIPTERP